MEETMPDITTSVLATSVMGKIYDVLINGDDTVPMSEDWSTLSTLAGEMSLIPDV
jgi:hypothetical protein